MRVRLKRRSLYISTFVFVILPILYASVCFGGELQSIRNMLRAKGHRWTAGETSVSRLPHHERKLRCGLIRPIASVGAETGSVVLSMTTLAATLDWRAFEGQNFVSKVRDQKNCGSCWAFATAGALESYILIRDNQPGNDEDRAEEILLSCSGAGSCDGGYIGKASEYIRLSGLPPESYFAYTETSSDNSCSSAQAGWQTNSYRIEGWSYVTTNSVSIDAIKNALVDGPLVTTMDVYNDFFTYQSGIYEYAEGSLAGGHAVLIVGYADDPSVSGGGYFVVKNSWGTGWGEEGYFNIAYSQTGSPVGFGEYTIAYKKGVEASLPGVPSNLTATPLGQNNILLAWSDSSENESGFKIERCTGSSCVDFMQVATVGSNVRLYTSNALKADTTYTFRVRAYNSSGNSTYSNQASATTFAPPASPTAPVDLSGTAASRTQINLSWTDTSSNEYGFRIERCTGLNCSKYKQIASVGPNIVQYSNTGLRKGTTYRYRIRAYNGNGASGYSDQVAVATSTLPVVPSIPANLSGTAVSQRQINLFWTDTSDNEKGFKIERCTGLNCSKFRQVASVGVNAIQRANTGLRKGTTYRYRVRAYNSDGNSDYSRTITLETFN